LLPHLFYREGLGEFAVHRLLVIFAAILLSNQGHAQTRNHLLSGLSKIKLVIEQLDSDAKVCGLSKQAIRAAVMYPFSSATIDVVADGFFHRAFQPHLDESDAVLSDAVLYVNINTLYLKADQACFSSLHIEAYTIQKVTLEFSGDEKLAQVLLWESGAVASSSPSQHAGQMTSSVEEKVKKFITDWNLDNKPLTPRRESESKKPTISSGSGFAVTQTGDFVTNEHVVSGCSAVTVRQGKREFTGTIAFRDNTVDLAVIHLMSPPLGELDSYPTSIPFARLRQSPELKMGDVAIAYGFPLRGALSDEGNLTVGNVSAMS
jgi:S1-C subfamily serine protease